MAAIHSPRMTELYDVTFPDPFTSQSDTESLTLLEILRHVYDSPLLEPTPYDPKPTIVQRFKDTFGTSKRTAELGRLLSKWKFPSSIPHDTLFASKIEEIIWTAALLLVSTGKPNRKPRLDFFIMHFVTSSLFMPSLLKIIKKPRYKATLLQAYVTNASGYMMIRGRPKIDGKLIMAASAHPHPPSPSKSVAATKSDAIGNPNDPSHANPWLDIIRAALYAPDSHVPKTIRTLVYGAQKYGDTPAGGVPGAIGKDGKETLPGLALVDGTFWVRAAGVVSDVLGWIDEEGKLSEGDWDRSGLGWEEAWNDGK